MSKRTFSDEEMAALRGNGAVSKVTQRTVDFTPAFKRELYDGLIDGKNISEMLMAAGVDPVMLGESRVSGLRDRLYKFGGRDEGFERKTPEKPTEEASLRKRITQLEHELAYTRQEVEFLKKTRMADLEAQKAWESRQRRK